MKIFENEFNSPFDNIKWFLTDSDTKEVKPKFRCNDCYDLMDTPYYWKLVVIAKDKNHRGFRFWCKDCYELRGGNV